MRAGRSKANELSAEESEFYGARLVELSCEREWLAQEFLAWYSEAATGLLVQDAFEEWISHRWPDPVLLPAERGLLLFSITHATSGEKAGKVRVMLDRPAGQQFTSLAEGKTLPTDEDLARVTAHMKRRPGETAFEHVERMAKTLYGVKEPAVRPMPEPSRVMTPSAGEQWLPYKEADDDLSDMVATEIVEDGPGEPGLDEEPPPEPQPEDHGGDEW